MFLQISSEKILLQRPASLDHSLCETQVGETPAFHGESTIPVHHHVCCFFSQIKVVELQPGLMVTSVPVSIRVL